MYTVRSVSVAEASPLQRQLSLSGCDSHTGRHYLDGFAERVGAFDGDELVGLVRLIDIDEEGRPSHLLQRMEGPFYRPGHEDCANPLLSKVLQQLPKRARLWRYHEPLPASSDSEYNADSIDVLKSPMSVRLRPELYVGSVDRAGVMEVIFEPVSNVLDEHLAGSAHTLDIHRNRDGSWTIADDGRGIPTSLHRYGESTILEIVMTQVHAGSSWGGQSHHVHAGRLGSGLAIHNALCESCEVTVENADGRWQQRYSRGLPQTLLESMKATKKRGTRVLFRPDPLIFGDATVEPEDLRERLFELACFNTGLEIRLQGERLEAPGGLRTLAERLAGGSLRDVREVDATAEGLRIRAALGWHDGPSILRSYCNQSLTPEGGSHVEGARVALAEVPKEGRVLVLEVSLSRPEFAGQSRDRLQNPEVRALVADVLESLTAG